MDPGGRDASSPAWQPPVRWRWRYLLRSEPATDELPTPSTGPRTTPGVAASMAFFFFRFDLDIDAPEGVGYEEHGEPGRLFRCHDGVENPPGNPLGGARMEMKCVGQGVSMFLLESVLPAADLPYPVSLLQSAFCCIYHAFHAFDLRVTHRGTLPSRRTYVHIRGCASARVGRVTSFLRLG